LAGDLRDQVIPPVIEKRGIIGIQVDNATPSSLFPLKPGTRWSPSLHHQSEVQ
jgi:hypothetical protein